MYADENAAGVLHTKATAKPSSFLHSHLRSFKARTALTDISNRNPPPAPSAPGADVAKKPLASRIPTVTTRHAPPPPPPSPTPMDTDPPPSASSSTSPLPPPVPAPAPALPLSLTSSDLKRSSSPSAPLMLAVDAPYACNAQYNVAYLPSILSHLHSSEQRKAPSPTYMSRQSDLTPRMREILVDWLVEVHVKFRLEAETLYLCVNIIDRFLERRAVMRSKLQLVGCTALLLASKYEEVFAPEVMDFVHVADRTYSKEQLLQMEAIVLQALHFNLTTPSPYRFLQRYHMLACALHVPGDAERTFRPLCEFLLELTLQEYRFLGYLPSLVAASVLYVGLETLGVAWSAELEGHVGYPLHADCVALCVRDVIAVAHGDSKYRAVRKKYSSDHYEAVSKLTIISPLHE